MKNKNYASKKFTEVLNTDEWEIHTEDGWKDIIASGKTIPYEIWNLELENGYKLSAADTHIVITFDKNNNKQVEKFLSELCKDDFVVILRFV
jgi:hypothetical protein